MYNGQVTETPQVVQGRQVTETPQVVQGRQVTESPQAVQDRLVPPFKHEHSKQFRKDKTRHV